MKTVNFKVTELTGLVKTGGKLKVGETYQGQLGKRGDKVWFTDFNNVDWVFYPGTTCELLN